MEEQAQQEQLRTYRNVSGEELEMPGTGVLIPAGGKVTVTSDMSHVDGLEEVDLDLEEDKDQEAVDQDREEFLASQEGTEDEDSRS